MSAVVLTAPEARQRNSWRRWQQGACGCTFVHLSASQASSVPKTNARMPHSDSRSSPCASGPTRVESGFYARRRALFDRCTCGSFNSLRIIQFSSCSPSRMPCPNDRGNASNTSINIARFSKGRYKTTTCPKSVGGSPAQLNAKSCRTEGLDRKGLE